MVLDSNVLALVLVRLLNPPCLELFWNLKPTLHMGTNNYCSQLHIQTCLVNIILHLVTPPMHNSYIHMYLRNVVWIHALDEVYSTLSQFLNAQAIGLNGLLICNMYTCSYVYIV